LKCASNILSYVLAEISNSSISLGTYPAKLKMSNIIPIFKVSLVGGFLRKMQKYFFFVFAVQIEKTEINILQKEWRKKIFLLFKIKRKTIFESH